MDLTGLPLQPPAPLPANATAEQTREWLERHRIAATYATAWAQAMSAASFDRLHAQQSTQQRISKAELAAALLPTWPHNRADTDAGIATEITKAVDALAAKYPGAFV